MIISYSKNFIVLHLEKTGGTTVEKSISPYLSIEDLYIRDWQAFFFNPNEAMMEHSPSSVPKVFLGDKWNRFKKFSTVRDPLEIMGSLYSYGRYIAVNTPMNEPVPEGAASAYLKTKNPDGFVREMFSKNYLMCYPQSERLQDILDDGMIVDLSTLNDRWHEITHYLNFHHSVTMINKNVIGSKDVEFSSQTEDLIRGWFAMDYELLPDITGVKWK